MTRAGVAGLALALAVFSTAAKADGLIDNVNGYTLDDKGQLQRFSALLIDDQGRVAKLIEGKTKRPEKLDFRLDAQGRTLIPGFIADHGATIALGFEALARAGEPRPKLRPRDRDDALAKAQDVLLAAGVTTTTDIGTSTEDWNVMRRAGDAGRLRVRIACYADSVAAMLSIAGGEPTPWLYGGRLRMIGAMVEAEGSPGPRDQPSPSDARLRNLMSRAAMDGFQVVVRPASPAGNVQALDAIDELVETYKGDRRWRIEPVGIIDPAEQPRLARNGTLVSAQPAGPWPAPITAIAADPLRLFPAYTLLAARAAFAEDRIGTLRPGRMADFLLIDRDIFAAQPDTDKAAQVLETWIGGVRAWVRR